MTALGGVRVLAFDMFGTTFDWWTGMRDQIAGVLAHKGVRADPGELASRWREQFFLGLERVRTGQREWANLDAIHAEGLVRVLADLGLTDALDGDRQELVRAWHRLPAWADVTDGVVRLGLRFTLCALSNGGFAQLTNLVKNAGLRFDCVLGADVAKHYKPDVQIYRSAAELLDVAPSEVLMVAAHGWDLDGARAAGFRTAYVARPDEYGPHRAGEDAEQVACDLSVRGFDELADALSCPPWAR